MIQSNQCVNENFAKKEKIVLGMMPFWTPLIPPMGAVSLKNFLQKYGYSVKTIDANVEESFKEVYYRYFNVLKEYVPEQKRGNFFNVGHDVLQDHMMAHIKYDQEAEYIELVKLLVMKTFYVDLTNEQVHRLNQLLEQFYADLEQYILNVLETEKPDVFGLTIYKGNIPASVFSCRLIRQKNPEIKILMGGGAFADSHAVDSPNFTALLEETEDCVDKIIVGQGEKLFLKYLQDELPQSQRVYTIKDINMELLSFDAIDIPDLSDVNMLHYPYLAATGSSSCPFECSFCNSVKFYGKYRQKEIKQLVDEMTKLYNQYGNQLFLMTDALLNPIITELSHEFIERDLCLYYDGYFRVCEEACDVDNTLLWRRGGLYRTRLGVESGSQHVLDMMDKQITVEELKKTVSNLAYAGIKTTTYWVIGHPGETEEDFQMTLDLLEELKDDIWQAECNPFKYHYSGQANSDDWAAKRRRLYPEEMKKMLVFDSWTLDLEPSREEKYDRMHRFMAHCKKLGIPNPYTSNELYKADIRWQKLHKNAVPSIVEFQNSDKYINECRNVSKIFCAQAIQDDGDFNF